MKTSAEWGPRMRGGSGFPTCGERNGPYVEVANMRARMERLLEMDFWSKIPIK
uniref:Uncharacterized protein n=1 Tax=Arundo donax TaxID=35708 RepID=A0A0A8ZFR7_ARUDO